ncbi:MAG: hypothetical protein BMS9Abin08_1224 [Gammaproteobacteria bacterium]|nr:MAG: hypothetical protein BMS9Abin08_1224 [Gammaproteobacteria bacterium]
MKSHLLPLLFSLLLLPTLLPAEERATIDRQEAASIARQVHPGRVLAVKPVQRGKLPAYRIKTLSADGNVHIIVIDAVSGQVISSR